MRGLFVAEPSNSLEKQGAAIPQAYYRQHFFSLFTFLYGAGNVPYPFAEVQWQANDRVARGRRQLPWVADSSVSAVECNVLLAMLIGLGKYFACAWLASFMLFACSQPPLLLSPW